MLAMFRLTVVCLACCRVGTISWSNQASLASLDEILQDDPRCLSSLRHIPLLQAESLADEEEIDVFKAHAKRCKDAATKGRHIYWIVVLRLAAYAARAAVPRWHRRLGVLKLVEKRPKIGRFGMCLPLSCLHEGKSEWSGEPSKTALGLTHWFTFHTLLNSSYSEYPADVFPPFESRDIKSISRCCNLTATPTCRSVTTARFPILKFFEREGVSGQMVRGLRVATLGAREDGYREDDGLRYLLHQGAEVFGFDSPEGCERTNAAAASATHARCGGRFHCIGRLIADGAKHRFFYFPENPYISSLYQPNRHLWAQMVSGFGARLFSLRNVSTVRLDDIGLEPIDFLKIDIQGAELMALSGAERVLQSALVVQVEVEMDYVYRGQPLFADIDQFLRQRGFTFHRFLDLRDLDRRPLTYRLQPLVTHQTFGDAVYVRGMHGVATDRSAPAFKPLAPSEAIRAAWILQEFYQSYDVALHLLNLYVPSVRKAYFLELADSLGLTDSWALGMALIDMKKSEVLPALNKRSSDVQGALLESNTWVDFDSRCGLLFADTFELEDHTLDQD
ncbi:ppsA [Symbiodinium microadriaticum]|nr:ppsA [Symbiodinium microadriaticum]CAE7939589.1 ppsA [Symbiodinium sp. KB8]